MYETPDPALTPGTQLSGFTVETAEPLPEISGVAYRMRHASGARLLWLACADTNRSFAISFKTPPADDTGVFHILEHSVLCGSDRFPVKEPFVNLLKSSMQTFLNALTFPDKTMYPVASTNVQDLENLMDVYLDAVLHPAIYARPRIFEQEGWHLEVADDGSLSYNGVVFNEMKGALSDPDDVLYNTMEARLFPDTAYAWVSGGDPRAIPTLTYERFIDTHARHYNLANSYTVLYGDLDIARELAFVAERFDGAPAREVGAPNPLAAQTPVVPEPYVKRMATAPENAAVALAYVFGASGDRERQLACEVLLDALMGSNEAPLKRRILDAGLGDDLACFTLDGQLQPAVMFELKGARGENVAERFEQAFLDACRELAEDGIPRERLRASISQAEFNLREREFGGYADGVALSMQVMSSWLYDDENPVAYLRYEDALANLKAGLDEGLFERLLRELVCESRHHARVELLPVEEGDAADETAELARLRAGMSDAELDAVRAEVATLRAEQERPDAPEALATLPRLSPAQIGDAAPEPPAPLVESPLPCIAHELDTHGIDYVYHYFDLRRVGFEELPYVTLLCELLGQLRTRRHSAEKLDTLIEENLGTLSFFTEVYSSDDDPDYVRPMLVVGARALSEKLEYLVSIPKEVWGSTLFVEKDRMLDLMVQQRLDMEQRFLNAGHALAMGRTATYYSKSALVGSKLGGVEYYEFLKDRIARWDQVKDQVTNMLFDLLGRIFSSEDVTVSFVGPAEDRERFWGLGGALGLETVGRSAEARLEIPEPEPRDEAFVVPSNVCFVAAGAPASPDDRASRGAWRVATRALSLDYLWNEVRVKGGAYGCGFRRTGKGLRQFYSYRDPGVDATVARFDGAAAWLAGWEPTQEELDGYVVATVASHDNPVKPRALARRQDAARFSLKPEGYRERVRAEELACSRDDLRAVAAGLADMAASRHVCVFGSRELIEAAATPLEIRELMGGEGEA